MVSGSLHVQQPAADICKWNPESVPHHMTEGSMVQEPVAGLSDLLGGCLNGAQEAFTEALLAALQAAAAGIQHVAEAAPGSIQALQICRLLLCNADLQAPVPARSQRADD